MKYSQKLFVIFFIIVVLSGGFFIYTKNRKVSNVTAVENLQNQNSTSVLAVSTGTSVQIAENKNIEANNISEVPQKITSKPVATADCSDFSKFSQIVLDNIDKPDVVMDIRNVYSGEWSSTGYAPDFAFFQDSFFWKRSQNEPFITYPINKSKVAIYKISNNLGEYISSAVRAKQSIKNDSSSLGQTIEKEALSLGFVSDTLNTIPFKSFDLPEGTEMGQATKEYKYFQTFAFRKESSLYLVVLDGKNHESGVTVTCGGANEQYDALYNWIKIKSDSKGISYIDDHENDFVSISKVSRDKRIYEVFNSQKSTTQATFFDVYTIIGGSITKLLKDGNKPSADCATLEVLKMGAEYNCNMKGGPDLIKYYFH